MILNHRMRVGNIGRPGARRALSALEGRPAVDTFEQRAPAPKARSHRRGVATYRCTAALTRLPCDLCRNVPHHLGQLAGTDFAEEAVELDVLRHRWARTKQRDIMLDRPLEIHDGKAIVIKHRRDISVMMIMKLLDEQVGRQSRRAAERVMNHNDILNSE